MGVPMIELLDVSKNLAGKQVLDHMSLTVEKGETKVIIGRSGVGKSVTLKHIVRLLEPDGGQVRVEGKDVLALQGKELNDLHMQIGLVFQGGALFDSMTVGENVGFIFREGGEGVVPLAPFPLPCSGIGTWRKIPGVWGQSPQE